MIAMAEFYGIRTQKIFCLCGSEIGRGANKCASCVAIGNRIVERPTQEQLLLDLKSTNFSQTGRKYGVSCNAIRKWCKSYGMSTKASDYK